VDHRTTLNRTKYLARKIQPGKLMLRTAGGCDLGPAHLLEVFGQQRRQFVAVLEGFGPDDWAALGDGLQAQLSSADLTTSRECSSMPNRSVGRLAAAS
jgi:hypothetical protein